ncbi:scp-like extracellular [Pyrenophora seminiperda CCB06]|uniref:Scp-like extracellular n=1 Tax=Pyrenophora seminiperda CCB06 TaxID=1302712 RepID=A0A3M7LYC1_9PLEO|nr:scp-like extracellular [Pyrenophora seminiperda CCB06]
MRYLLLVTSALAVGVIARPQLLRRQAKIVYETEVVIRTVVVTITQDYVAPSTSCAMSHTVVSVATPTPRPKPVRSSSTLVIHTTTAVSSMAATTMRTPTPKPSTTTRYLPSGTGQAYLSAGPEYQAAVLFHHNAARAKHNAAPLSWDSSCESNARIAASKCEFKHFIPRGAGQGQNIFVVSGSAFNVTAGISESWYRGELLPMMPWFGKSDLPHDVFEEVGHLTQMVWKGTTKVGCVSLDCGSAMTVNGQKSTMNKFTVCNYAPAGNFGGQYAINVAAPISSTNLVGWAD